MIIILDFKCLLHLYFWEKSIAKNIFGKSIAKHTFGKSIAKHTFGKSIAKTIIEKNTFKILYAFYIVSLIKKKIKRK